MNRWLREPLLHFLIAGVILFTAFDVFRGDDPIADSDTIIVDRRALLTFLQYRANAFDPETFGAALDGMTDRELEEVIDSYIKEEILYREALELGLETSDNIIRQRMVQKMSFLLTDIAAADSSTDPEALETWFEANLETYAIQPWATFTHVFFDAEKRGPERALAAAQEAARDLNASGAGFNDAPGFGDRFPFLRNYVERTLEYVAGHFGYEFVAAIEALDPTDSEWQGPFESVYGQHVILLTHWADRSYPELDEVRSAVERDLATELSKLALDEITRSVRERYTVRIDEIRSLPGQ
jgi:hypothetical protein